MVVIGLLHHVSVVGDALMQPINQPMLPDARSLLPIYPESPILLHSKYNYLSIKQSALGWSSMYALPDPRPRNV
jgi:hypothetical protein